MIHDEVPPSADPVTERSKFWVRFEGAYSALLATARGGAPEWPTANTIRGSIKIARRDAIVIAEGIAALMEILADARRAQPVYAGSGDAHVVGWPAADDASPTIEP